MVKLLLFDLDGTLLRTDKTVSPRTLAAIRKCKEKGMLIGISTSRAEHNCAAFLLQLKPDVFIASGGAVVKCKGDIIYTAEFSREQTRAMIVCARQICGADCEISIDTLHACYWNYKILPTKADATWGETIYTDFSNCTQKALKFCVEVFDEKLARRLAEHLSDCDCQRFAGSAWYKFTKKEATKENAIRKACQVLEIELQDVTAFGDDAPDIGMLKLCGTGIAMGNAIPAVKETADLVIGSNDADGIAVYLETVVE